jgi:hypothetical protein
MESSEAHSAGNGREDALVEALVAPGGSFVDALLALADEAANGNEPDRVRRAMSGGFQAALAHKMRATIAGRDSATRDAA